MSQSHIRVQSVPTERKPWLEAAVAVAFVIALLGVAVYRFGDWESKHNLFSVHGKVLETRIVTDYVQDTQMGGHGYYRVEARVKYEIDGKPQDRWMTASELTYREELLAQLKQNPDKCLVFWPPDHPENVQCRLELPH